MGGCPIRLEFLAEKAPARRLTLENGSRVAVVGGGPAGSLFATFLLDFAGRDGKEISVEIFDAKDFKVSGPKGCNHCGGIISESLVQHLAAEGIVLPANVVQRGLDAYVLHTDDGSVGIATPLQEKRIAATYRGGGPRGSTAGCWASFDGFLLDLAARRGATVRHERVTTVDFAGERPVLTTAADTAEVYDLVAGATGVNAAPKKLFENVHLDFRPAETSRTFISEFRFGQEQLQELLGDAMHVFLLDIPRLQFAAIIPKGEFATLVLLGDQIDKELVARFLDSPEVRSCFPAGLDIPNCFDCQCYPWINVSAAVRPFADRLVLIGDVAATKLYKNGIGAAYLAAKSAAAAAVFDGISARAFDRNYGPTCRAIERDNRLGRLIFAVTGLVKRLGFVKGAFLRVIQAEQGLEGRRRRLSMVMWDTFTGSAAYGSILKRMLHPALLAGIIKEITMGLFRRPDISAATPMTGPGGVLGKTYADGEVIVRQGDEGHCMYVIQEGEVQVCRVAGDKEIPIAVLTAGGFFGEMSLFEKDVRSSTVRALGPATVLTIDQHTLLNQITANPSLALHLIREMSGRIRNLNHKHARVLADERRDWETRPRVWSGE